MLINKEVVINKELTILCILEKDSLYFLESNPVQEQRYLLCNARIFYSCTKASDISHLRDIHKTTRKSAIDIRLNGVTENDIRFYSPNKFHVLQDKQTIDNRICAMSSNLDVVIFATQFH